MKHGVQCTCRSHKSMKKEHHFNNLFLYPSRTTHDSACTVSGNILFRCDVMMRRQQIRVKYVKSSIVNINTNTWCYGHRRMPLTLCPRQLFILRMLNMKHNILK